MHRSSGHQRLDLVGTASYNRGTAVMTEDRIMSQGPRSLLYVKFRQRPPREEPISSSSGGVQGNRLLAHPIDIIMGRERGCNASSDIFPCMISRRNEKIGNCQE